MVRTQERKGWATWSWPRYYGKAGAATPYKPRHGEAPGSECRGTSRACACLQVGDGRGNAARDNRTSTARGGFHGWTRRTGQQWGLRAAQHGSTDGSVHAC